MGLLGALLFLGGIALIVGGIIGEVLNRAGPDVDGDRVIRTVNVPSGPLVAYNQAMEEKQAAQQQVETERQRLAQQEIIAQQRVATARGEAEAQIERARGEAEANRLVGASLTAAILQNRYIEKLSDQISVMLVPSEGGGLILDLGSLTPTPTPTAPPAP